MVVRAYSSDSLRYKGFLRLSFLQITSALSMLNSGVVTFSFSLPKSSVKDGLSIYILEPNRQCLNKN